MKRRQKTTVMKKHALPQWQSEFDVQAEVSLVLKFPNVSLQSASARQREALEFGPPPRHIVLDHPNRPDVFAFRHESSLHIGCLNRKNTRNARYFQIFSDRFDRQTRKKA
jgi:hypothetical protein